MKANYWAVVPAAGNGSRMGAALPKQYLPLAGRTVLEHTLRRLCGHARLAGVVVAIAPHDIYWQSPEGLRVMQAPGGEARCHSVLNALRVLSAVAHEEDWVLVHDAARPCVRLEDVDLLITTLAEDAVGGLLGVPVNDTLKQVHDQRVAATAERAQFWRALTPQMFRLGTLTRALEQSLAAGVWVTDEAQAIERLGLQPRMVAGHADNIKITVPQDLQLAEYYLKEQARCA